MRFFTTALALLSPALVSAAPTHFTRSQHKANIAVLKFAQVLEVLETEFYSQALQKFQSESDFQAAGISVPQIAIQGINDIRLNEDIHSQVLLQVIRDSREEEIKDCRLDFGAALNDVASMIATARVLEITGVGAYIGGGLLLSDPKILFAAASILTVEARHNTFTNTLNGATGIPQAFDIGLTPGDVLTIAGGFVSGCNLVEELDFRGLRLEEPKPPLQIRNSGVVVAGTKLDLFADDLERVDINRLSCQMVVGGAETAIVLPADDCVVPEGINGPVVIFLTHGDEPLQGNIVHRLRRGGQNDLIFAGPTIAFIDVVPDALGVLVRNNGQEIDFSQNISPEEAEQQIEFNSAGNPEINSAGNPEIDSAGNPIEINTAESPEIDSAGNEVPTETASADFVLQTVATGVEGSGISGAPLNVGNTVPSALNGSDVNVVGVETIPA